jgi:HSP20 family protein
MREQEISVTLDGDVLLIRGTRTDPTEQRAFHQMEIRFGEFTVAALLPGAVDEQTASATYEDGFLVVTLPKT